jgi:hypothetical protein
MAFATGSVDVLECLMRKIGVQDSEFTKSTGTGRIHIYEGDGKVNVPGAGMFNIGGANAGANTPTETTLVGSLANLKKYDMVLFPCKGAEKTRSGAELTNLKGYADAGGRVFTTHFSYVWLFNNAPFSTTAQWNVGQLPAPADQTGFIDTSFPKGLALAQWLQNIGASNVLGQIPIQVLKHDLNGVNAPSQTWMSINNPSAVMHYTFNTPVGAPPANQCGRVLFDDFHVENHGFINQNSAYGLTFPAECDNTPMNAQEKLLEFMIFDLGSCVTPDIPVCNKTTCAAQSIQCGPAGDGCGGLLDCGPCPPGQTCGGGGVPGLCGSLCIPKTCAALGFNCGLAGDGCGGQLDCGVCSPPNTCGGGGDPNVCGGSIPK